MTTIRQDYATCRLEIEQNGVATLTLNDSKRMNPINVDSVQDIKDAVSLLRHSGTAQVLILTGSGPAFSAGGDISVLAGMDSVENAKWSFDCSSDAVRMIYELEIPVIAAVNGVAAGAALAMMMACDLIIAADSASFFFSFGQIAFTPDSGMSYFLVRRLGYHKAAELLIFGRKLIALEALELGLLNNIVPEDSLQAAARQWADTIAAGPMTTVGYDKKLLRAAIHNDFYEQQELESLYQLITWSSQDFREGAAAFAEKRKPRFSGKWRLQPR